ncbi:MAG TPA: RcnB family protein [Xanthobacteraceae bacterium]|nr:RcnB family protein [Xanthobacteraceae bacterium]
MLRVLAIAAAFAFALPNLALAQEHHEEEHRGGPPHGAPPHPPGAPAARPAIVPGGPPPGGHPPGFAHPGGPPPTAFAHPGGPPGHQFSYRGRMVERMHVNPFIYPQGWGYRRWAIGAALPPLFLARDYWYADWASLGLAPPPPGTEWVRYGPDLLLVDVSTGQVLDTVYDAFY